jgi:hypothetical protein
VRRVLDPNRNPRMLVVIIYEEAINQFPGVAYFGGMFSGGEVSVRAMNYIHECQYPVWATIDVAGCWTLTPKGRRVFLLKTASKQPLLKASRIVQNWNQFRYFQP